MSTKKGTWNDPAIIGDRRIDHENETVRAVAERLHSNESMHLHECVSSTICPYCALRASRVLRWAAEHHKADQACNSYTVNAPMFEGNDRKRFVSLLCVYCGHGPGEHR